MPEAAVSEKNDEASGNGTHSDRRPPSRLHAGSSARSTRYRRGRRRSSRTDAWRDEVEEPGHCNRHTDTMKVRLGVPEPEPKRRRDPRPSAKRCRSPLHQERRALRARVCGAVRAQWAQGAIGDAMRIGADAAYSRPRTVTLAERYGTLVRPSAQRLRVRSRDRPPSRSRGTEALLNNAQRDCGSSLFAVSGGRVAAGGREEQLPHRRSGTPRRNERGRSWHVRHSRIRWLPMTAGRSRELQLLGG